MEPISLLVMGILGVIGVVYGGDRVLNSKKVQATIEKRKEEKERQESDKQHLEDLDTALEHVARMDIKEGLTNVSIDEAYFKVAEDRYRKLESSDYRYARDNYPSAMQRVRNQIKEQEEATQNRELEARERKLQEEREIEMFNAVRKATAKAIKEIEEKPLDDFRREMKEYR